MSKKGEHIPKKDLTGNRYGKLTVIEYAGYKTGTTGVNYHQWLCKCDCGNTKIATTTALLSGHCKSCGCMPHKPHHPHFTHHLTNTKIHNVWKAMKGRCYTLTDSAYDRYGARGIKVCDEWKNDFMKFYEWCIDHGYKEVTGHNKTYTIDRMDPNGDYEPSNCRLATMKQQSTTKTNTKYVDLDGILYTTRELSDKYHIPYAKLRARLDNGESTKQALFGDHSKIKHKIEYKGEIHSVPEWSEITGIKKETIYARFYSGLTPEQIFETPTDRKHQYIYQIRNSRQ